jgi:hypothetical protein
MIHSYPEILELNSTYDDNKSNLLIEFALGLFVFNLLNPILLFNICFPFNPLKNHF